MFSQQKTILITGGAVYIGSHTVKALKQSGYKVWIFDRLIYRHRDLVEILQVPLIIGDISDRLLGIRQFSSVVVRKLASYLDSNLNTAILKLLRLMLGNGIN